MADKIKFKKPVDFNGQTIENLNIPAEALAGKQDKLTAGDNITIEDNVISATTDSDICVKKSGDTMTGSLSIKSAEDPMPLIITKDGISKGGGSCSVTINLGSNGGMLKTGGGNYGYILPPYSSSLTANKTIATTDQIPSTDNFIVKSGGTMTGDLSLSTNFEGGAAQSPSLILQGNLGTTLKLYEYGSSGASIERYGPGPLTIKGYYDVIITSNAFNGSMSDQHTIIDGTTIPKNTELATQDWANNSFVKKGKLYEHRVQLSNSPLSYLVYYSTFSHSCSRSDLENITDQILSGSFITSSGSGESTSCHVFFGGRRDDVGGSSGVWIYYLSENGAMTKITTSWNSNADIVTPII